MREIDDYVAKVMYEIDHKKEFVNPDSGKKYSVSNWVDASSSMDEHDFIKIMAPLVRGNRGVTYHLRKRSLSGKIKEELIIGILYPGNQKGLEKVLQEIKGRAAHSSKRTYIVCLPAMHYTEWKLPTIPNVYFVIADLVRERVYLDQTVEFKGAKEYKDIFMPGRKHVTTALPVQELKNKVIEHINSKMKLTYSATSVARELSLQKEDIEEAFFLLQNSGFLNCRVEDVDGEEHLYLFSTISPTSRQEEGAIDRLEKLLESVLKTEDEKTIEDYKGEVNVIDIKLHKELEKRENEYGTLEKWYNYHAKKKNSATINEIIDIQKRLKEEIGNLQAQRQRVEKLKDIISREKGELLPESVVEGVSNSERKISEEEKEYARIQKLTDILLEMKLPKEEVKGLVERAHNPDWWLNDWTYESNMVCPSCNLSGSVSSIEIETSKGKRRTYYCDECGYVW